MNSRPRHDSRNAAGAFWLGRLADTGQGVKLILRAGSRLAATIRPFVQPAMASSSLNEGQPPPKLDGSRFLFSSGGMGG